MFISGNLIYIDLHKTGCSHIRRMLSATIGGNLVGKHNRVDSIDRRKFIVGSIRNPWDWYLSLWAFGCSRQGAVHGRTTRRLDLDCYRSGLQREMCLRRPPWGAILKTVASDLGKPVATWRRVYSDPDNPAHFREWLRLILDPARRLDIGEGFGISPVSRHSGLLTYRYLKLYSDSIDDLYRNDGRLDTYDAMRAFDARHNMLNAMIRNEHLEGDLLAAIASAGYTLSDEQTRLILDGKHNKTNASVHRDSRYYYDADSAALLARHERLIIDKHGYASPLADT